MSVFPIYTEKTEHSVLVPHHKPVDGATPDMFTR